MKEKPLVIFLVGPTGVGKSALGIELAKRIQGEIISADSMQIYKGMDIGTAKLTAHERQIVPHHLIDIISPLRTFSVYDFRQRALKKIDEIITRSKTPIVVGGSGLYVRALLEGLSEQPGSDAAMRRRLQKEAKKKGVSSLYQKLLRSDSKTAQKIKSADLKRIVRALEIIESSGKNPSDWFQEKQSLSDLGFKPIVIGVTRERQELYRDIEARVDSMFRRGWVSEVKKLSKGKVSRTAAQALGYQEIREWLKHSSKSKKGDGHTNKNMCLSPFLLKELIKQKSRRFAKRQITWFKKEKDIQWVVWQAGESVQSMGDRIINGIQRTNIKNQNFDF